LTLVLVNGRVKLSNHDDDLSLVDDDANQRRNSKAARIEMTMNVMKRTSNGKIMEYYSRGDDERY
jgi:hypothetical protein